MDQRTAFARGVGRRARSFKEIRRELKAEDSKWQSLVEERDQVDCTFKPELPGGINYHHVQVKALPFAWAAATAFFFLLSLGLLPQPSYFFKTVPFLAIRLRTLPFD